MFIWTIKVAPRVTRLGEILPFGRFFMALGEFLSRKNRPMIWAKFQPAMKKSPKIALNKAKFLFQERFFTCLSKIFKKFYPFFMKKTIKECPVPLDISIKSNRKHHKTVLYSKSNKNIVGRLFGQLFHKNIWSPWQCL